MVSLDSVPHYDGSATVDATPKDLDYYLYHQPIPDDGRPNPHLSNYPIGPGNAWASGIAIGFLIVEAIVVVVLNLYLWKYRKTFPLTVTNVPLMIVSAFCCIPMHFAYTHHLIAPMMPCWAHIISYHLSYLGFTAAGFSMQLRLYFSHRVQFEIANNNHKDWFVQHKDLLKGTKIDFFVTVGTLLVSSFLLIVRFTTVSHEILAAPMADLRCTSFGTIQFVADIVNKISLLIVNQLLARSVKNVDEAYPFSEKYLASAKLIAVFVELQDIPFFLKQFKHGMDRTIFDNLNWACMLVWSMVMCASFLYNSEFLVLKAAVNYRKRKPSFSMGLDALATGTDSKTLKSGSASKVSPTVIEEVGKKTGSTSANVSSPALTKILTSSELMVLLRSHAEVQEGFKQYLVREFCVESMVFIIRTFEYEKNHDNRTRASEISDEILRNFIDEGSLLEINISSSLRKTTAAKVRELLQQLGSAFPENLFEKTQEAVLKMLLDPFHRYQKTLLRK